MKPSLGPVGVGALIVLAFGLVFFALRAGTTTITYDDSPPVSIPTTGVPVVASLREAGGFSLLGVHFGSRKHFVEVQFMTQPGCSALLTPGDPWPPPYPECTSTVSLTGTVGGLGVTADGRSLVGVQMTVSRACFEQLERGMTWPSGLDECGAPG